ncbi:MAG: PucR family transcriptional regulator [Mycobacterium sp.]
MAEAHRGDEAVVAESAASMVSRLGERLDELTDSVQHILVAEIPELEGDAQLQALLRDNIEENIDTAFSTIRHNIPIEHVEPPTTALEYARRLAQRGVSANALVRAYRLGHQIVLDRVLTEIRAAKLRPQLSLDVYEHVTAILFNYVDWITQQVIITYQSEHDSWLSSQNSVRALKVRELLDDAEVDVDAMTAAIRYPLERIHLAAVVWYRQPDNGHELLLMERFVRQLAQSVGAHESSLFISVDRLTGWAWIPLPAEAVPKVAAQTRMFVDARTDAPWIALGNPLPGVEGFRRSHRQAQDTRTVAIALGAQAQRVTAASDPGLSTAAMLGHNLDAARAWVDEVLGPLAAPTDSDERLRETLRIFLRSGSSYKAAAEELHLHVNSVKYRVHRAVDRRGRPIGDDRLDVEVALLLCHWYPATVLG